MNHAHSTKVAARAINVTTDNQRKFPPLEGTYSARVESVKFKIAKTGSRGVEICYKIEDPRAGNRKVWESIFLFFADGTPTEYGNAGLLRRAKAAGITGNALTAFKSPEFDGDDANLGDVPKFVGAPVILTCYTKDGRYTNVKSAHPRS